MYLLINMVKVMTITDTEYSCNNMSIKIYREYIVIDSVNQRNKSIV